MPVTDDTDTASRRAHLVAYLSDHDYLIDPRWRAAFAEVPRHRFAPAAFSIDPRTGQPGRLLRADNPADRDTYLDAVYADDAIVTQRADDGRATSSSTQPAVMASMLHALDLHDGDDVLEIGTGTGYNAALLCHRLGDQHVTSIDIDPALVDAARAALAACGYRPRLAAADGLEGFPPAGPYDRIIATCSTQRVPAAWLAQTRPGGLILANLSYGVAPLQVGADGTAAGQFSPQVAGFIEARPADGPRGWTTRQLLDHCATTPHDTATGRAEVFEAIRDDDFDFVWHLVMPGITWCGLAMDTGMVHCFGDAATQSWTQAHQQPDGTITVSSTGPRRLWHELSCVYRWWHHAGHPRHERLGLTITPDGAHTLWIDQPTDPNALPLLNAPKPTSAVDDPSL
jgi:methyltransferase of ATP-grasp peptide maturase system